MIHEHLGTLGVTTLPAAGPPDALPASDPPPAPGRLTLCTPRFVVYDGVLPPEALA